MIYRAIKDLAQYGIAKGLIEKEDEVYVINSILQELQLDEYYLENIIKPVHNI